MSNIVEKIESEVEAALKAVENLFTSGKAQAAIAEAGSLVTIALPIVQELDTLCPNKTGPEVVAAIQELLSSESNLQPILAEAESNPSGALLALATSLLEKNLPAAKAGTAVNILNTTVQLAVTAAHAL
jgi:hypothetical protein